jgi:hypothetical protein
VLAVAVPCLNIAFALGLPPINPAVFMQIPAPATRTTKPLASVVFFATAVRREWFSMAQHCRARLLIHPRISCRIAGKERQDLGIPACFKRIHSTFAA